MRKLDLGSFDVTQKVKGGDGEIIEVTGSYNVKDSVLNIMFLPALELRGAALVKQNVLAMKIEQSDGNVMLEEEEYARVRHAAELYPGQRRADATLINRILNETPEIE